MEKTVKDKDRILEITNFTYKKMAKKKWELQNELEGLKEAKKRIEARIAKIQQELKD